MIVGPRNVIYRDARQVIFTTDIKMPDGTVKKDFLCCDFGPSVTVLSVFRSQRAISAIMQNSYKPATGQTFITTQAGGIEKRLVGDHFELLETPEEAAKREVKEEAGADVLELKYLGFTNHYASKLMAPEHLFLAIVEPPAMLAGDEEEDTKPFVIEWNDLKKRILGERGELFMPVTLTVVLRATPIVDQL